MQLNDEQLTALVAKVVGEVMKRIQFETMNDETVTGTVAVFTSFVPSKKACSNALTERYGSGIDCALLGEAEFDMAGFLKMKVSTKEDEQILIERLARTANVVLVTPSLSLLYRLAAGDDSGIAETSVLRPLLWGRKVSVLLDFDVPRFKRATFFEKVVDALDVLTNMGVSVISYNPASEKEEEKRLSLITETQVREAAEDGSFRILCANDAIVTPLAKEKAEELGVALD